MEEGRKAAVAQANTLWLGWFFSVAVSHAARCKSVTTFQHVEKTKIKGNLLWFNEFPLPSCSPPFADIIQADRSSKQGAYMPHTCSWPLARCWGTWRAWSMASSHGGNQVPTLLAVAKKKKHPAHLLPWSSQLSSEVPWTGSIFA